MSQPPLSMSPEEHTSTDDAQLSQVKLAGLIKGDPETRHALLAACEKNGFFHLDIVGGDDQFLQTWNKLLEVMAGYFHQPQEIKMLDDRQSDTHGYEPIATSAGAVSRDELRQNSPRVASIVKTQRAIFEAYIASAHAIVSTVLRELSVALGDQFPLAEAHSDDRTSRSTLSVFRYPKQDEDVELSGLGHNKHTDLGTLTLLLCRQWGLQVLTEDKGWQFVAPRPGCAVVNVGDSLRFLSGLRLRSVVHRVVPRNAAHRQDEDRYSVAYFLRPADDVTYRDVNGRTVSAWAWHNDKFNMFRQPHDIQESNAVATGGMERADTFIF
ncbi:putative 2OG-Fe(II) oxygenase family oxidoreductase [Fusarium tricinctum]|uniref:2OG-Fe(II) oxygenase family oxidoreductase n=1 Tax=Fusarium tricinctum TaxID=61284 RepID=A0A8K0S381_9HYPO|nr:putative 2OG-Fe(II) oxygenase family oxidoreductase [Fusarium tricinctum]